MEETTHLEGAFKDVDITDCYAGGKVVADETANLALLYLFAVG